ncbi:MAG: IPTL-CTERM sorting domain-containing protein [Rhizobacter sp.]
MAAAPKFKRFAQEHTSGFLPAGLGNSRRLAWLRRNFAAWLLSICACLCASPAWAQVCVWQSSGINYATAEEAVAARCNQIAQTQPSERCDGITTGTGTIFPANYPRVPAPTVCTAGGTVHRLIVDLHSSSSDTFLSVASLTPVNAAFCPTGHTWDGLQCSPDIDPNENCDTCPTTNNPVHVGSGAKRLTEPDFSDAGPGHLSWTRYYNSLVSRSGAGAVASAHWTHTYSRFVQLADSTHANLYRADGSRRKAQLTTATITNGRQTWAVSRLHAEQLIRTFDSSGTTSTGWIVYESQQGNVETYGTNGLLSSIAFADGVVHTLIYSDGTSGANGGFVLDASGNPTTTALPAGQLIRISDSFGKSITQGFNSQQQPVRLTDPFGNVYRYGFDTQGNLSSALYPDGKSRNYIYNESANTGAASLPYALTGVIDETGARLSTFKYDATGRAVSSTQWADASQTQPAGKSTFVFAAGNTTQVTDALGATRNYGFSTNAGLMQLNTQSQPAGSGSPAASAGFDFDANANLIRNTDFNGNTSCYVFDLTRNLESARVEGLAPGIACPTNVAAYTPTAVTLQRKIFTQWHPTSRVPVRRSEPKKVSTWVYQGQVDPTTGSTVNCVAGNPLLDGNPLPRLCRNIEQATTDESGSQGFAATTSGLARITNYSYNASGQLLSVDGARTDLSDITSYAYYTATDTAHTSAQFHAGELQSATDALGHATQFTQYDGAGRVLAMTDINGNAVSMSYFPRGWLQSFIIDGKTTNLSYAPSGQLLRVTLPDASFVQYGYDTAHRLTSITDALNNQRLYTRDSAGNITRTDTLNADGSTARTHSQVFDALGRLQTDLGSQNQTTVYGYDADSQRSSVQDPRSTAGNLLVTTLAYDELRRLKQISDANAPSGLTQFTYDGLDQLTQVVSPNNATTSYTIDGLGQLTQEVSPDRGSVTSTFDAAGNLRTRTDARGITATVTLDALNRVTGISYPSAGENVARVYDSAPGSPVCSNGIGRLCQTSDAGGVSRYTYDARGNTLSVTRTELGQTYTTSYAYSAANRLLSITTPTGKTLSLTRDAAGRVNTVSAPVAGVATALASGLTYDGAQALVSRTQGNGVVLGTSFNADGRLSASTAVAPAGGGTGADVPTLPEWGLLLLGTLLGGTVLRQGKRHPDAARRLLGLALVWALGLSLAVQPMSAYAFDTGVQYDAAGNVVTRSNVAGSSTFTYDRLGRLGSESGPAASQVFTYDSNSNRLSDGSGSYVVQTASNRYSTVRGAAASYDLAGSLTSINGRTLAYNQTGRLASVSQGATLLASYTYDALGQRTRKALSAAGAQLLGLAAVPLTVVYHYSLGGELLAETTSSGVPIRTYVWLEDGAGGTPIPLGQFEHPNNVAYGGSNATPTELFLYFDSDALNTPRSASNAQGREVWRWVSDAFGSTAPNEDVDGDGKRTVVNLRFAGQYADGESGLVYNGMRDYDARMGRFAESDPIGLVGGFNSYAYVGSNPLSGVDPLGLWVYGTYDRASGTLTLHDLEKDTTISGQFESGGKPWGDPIPQGQYDLLTREGRGGFFRLESVDAHYGDDMDDSSGRTNFRLHHPGRTLGCVAAKDEKNWADVNNFIISTATDSVSVDSKSRNPFAPKTEALTRYGRIVIIH